MERSLLTCSYGKQVLQAFQQDGKLNASARDHLAASIVRKLMSHSEDGIVKNSDFQAIASVIPQLFPKEAVVRKYSMFIRNIPDYCIAPFLSYILFTVYLLKLYIQETYYIPPYVEGKSQKVSKGKLPNKYKNIKISLKSNSKNEKYKKGQSRNEVNTPKLKIQNRK